MSYLFNFVTIRPRFEASQEEALDWLVCAHTQAESVHKGLSPAESSAFSADIKERLWHVAAKPDVIAKRGHEIADFCHQRWPEMEVYCLSDRSEGASLEIRQQIHARIVKSIFERFYPHSQTPPKHLIHVSCTGYDSPSGAQKIVSKHGWRHTAVSHVYHMGCYAAIPAVRLAQIGPSDIVHTELSTLHNQPLQHSTEQLVAQSLFADGFIKYSVSPEAPGQRHFKLLGIHEENIPDSIDSMAWTITDSGFRMTLAIEIPRQIKGALAGFLDLLLTKAELNFAHTLTHAYFAIHPGGPRILQSAQRLLRLSDRQMTATYGVLRDYGNMSSATLPHIWTRLLDDDSIPSGSVIVSIGFGPGLTIAGVVLQKVNPCGS